MTTAVSPRRPPYALTWLLATGTLLFGTALTGAAPARAALPYRDASASVAARAADLLARMTLDDKVGQMTQAERGEATPADVTAYRLGSVLSGGGSGPSTNTPAAWADMIDGFQRGALATPLGIPILYGVDAVHGNNNVYGSTIFPHNIGLGATRDPALVQRIGRAVAEEVVGSGANWTFAPCLCVARDDRWGRTYESFGEDPDLVSSMATVVTGFQQETLGSGPASVLASAKHYLGDGGTAGGKDQGDTRVTEAELRSIHLPPFRAAIERGVGSIMVSFSSWNGAKLHSNTYLLTDVLKKELGYQGFLVSDWAGIDQIDQAAGFTESEVAVAVNAGLDMIMVPNNFKTFIGYLKNAVNSGRIPMSRIDDAVSRILTQKIRMGLFERPLADRSYTSSIGSQAHRDLARQAVRKSQVVLKNAGGVLPLPRRGRILVAGKNADDLGNQAGGWTVTWQGASGRTIPGTSILQGMRDAVGSSGAVTYSKDGSGIDPTYTAAVAVVGETPYAEGAGDRTSLALDRTDQATLARLEASGVPLVVLVVSGRPLELPSTSARWAGLIASWLPGSEGAGVADVLFGSSAPTGKLPLTWPLTTSQHPINVGDGKTGAFPYGAGLTWSDR
jgi:beta-glucosidase